MTTQNLALNLIAFAAVCVFAWCQWRDLSRVLRDLAKLDRAFPVASQASFEATMKELRRDMEVGS